MKPTVDTAYLHFDETGSIPAIKYARITLGMGLPIIAARNDREVIVGTVNRDGNPLYNNADKIVRVSRDCVVLVTGHGGDTNQVRQLLRDLAVNHKFVLGSEVSPKEVSLALSDYLHQLGMSYRRPLGVGIIVAGFDRHGNDPVIYHCDVDGNATDRVGIALGKESSQAEHVLQEGMKGKGKKLEDVVRAAAEATLKGMKESNVDLGNQQFRVEVVVLRPAA
ncbi:MAG: proteasome subunit alpha 6 [Thermoplasmata archaeon]|jgi:20S proteasome alpha/beta subunit|nr:proteasome subunit alpha 6 [Thermoplasmata archaeon]